MKNMKKYLMILVAVFAMASLITGCGASKETAEPKKETPTTQEAPVEKIKIALILPSTVDDMAWSQSMVEGIKAVQKQLGEDKVEVAVSEKLGKPVDAGAAIRQYATQGFDIIFAHGSQYQGVLSELAKDFPKTSFAYGSGFKTEPNVFAYDPQAQEGGYLLGVLAAKMSKSGVVGIVGPVESGDAVKYNYGVQQGIAQTNAQVKARIAYTGSFNDIVGAGELAKTHIGAGADILTGSSQQAVGAARAVASKPGTYWLSTDMDQSSIAPESVLASQVYNWEKLVNQIIELRKEGTLGGKHLTISFAEGTIDLKYNSKLEGIIPQEVKDAVEKAKQDIISGALKVELPQPTEPKK